jgi:hypothetical protein
VAVSGRAELAPAVLQSRLADPAAERLLRELLRQVEDLRRRPATGLTVLANVELEDGVETPIAHGLGRAPALAWWSLPRGPATVGMVEEVRSDAFNREDHLVLKASGFGATITLDVGVL